MTKLFRSADPTQYASGYTLDLYCDHLSPRDFSAGIRDTIHRWDEFPHQFMGETFAECAQQARRRGWAIHQHDRTATCPKCSGRPRILQAPKDLPRETSPGTCQHGHSLSSHDVCPRCDAALTETES